MGKLKKPYLGAVLENAKGVQTGDICELQFFDENYHLVENRWGEDVKVPQDYVVFLGDNKELDEDTVITASILHASERQLDGTEALDLISLILQREITPELVMKTTLLAEMLEETLANLFGEEGEMYE